MYDNNDIGKRMVGAAFWCSGSSCISLRLILHAMDTLMSNFYGISSSNLFIPRSDGEGEQALNITGILAQSRR
jgi:hypothetical protein